MLAAWMPNGFNTSSTFDSRKLPQRPGIQSAVVTMDTNINTSLKDRSVRTCIPVTMLKEGSNFIQHGYNIEKK